MVCFSTRVNVGKILNILKHQIFWNIVGVLKHQKKKKMEGVLSIIKTNKTINNNITKLFQQ